MPTHNKTKPSFLNKDGLVKTITLNILEEAAHRKQELDNLRLKFALEGHDNEDKTQVSFPQLAFTRSELEAFVRQFLDMAGDADTVWGCCRAFVVLTGHGAPGGKITFQEDPTGYSLADLCRFTQNELTKVHKRQGIVKYPVSVTILSGLCYSHESVGNDPLPDIGVGVKAYTHAHKRKTDSEVYISEKETITDMKHVQLQEDADAYHKYMITLTTKDIHDRMERALRQKICHDRAGTTDFDFVDTSDTASNGVLTSLAMGGADSNWSHDKHVLFKVYKGDELF